MTRYKNPAARAAAEQLIVDLQPLGVVTTRAMFGGYGIFIDSVMFAMIDTAAAAYFRVDHTTRPDYENEDSVPHGDMPYWSIPPAIRSNDTDLLTWAGRAIAVAHHHRGS